MWRPPQAGRAAGAALPWDRECAVRLWLSVDQPVAQIAFAVTVQLLFVLLISWASATQVVALPDVRAPGSLCTIATLSASVSELLAPPPMMVLPAGEGAGGAFLRVGGAPRARPAPVPPTSR